jgi:hypothetical protein
MKPINLGDFANSSIRIDLQLASTQAPSFFGELEELEDESPDTFIIESSFDLF